MRDDTHAGACTRTSLDSACSEAARGRWLRRRPVHPRRPLRLAALSALLACMALVGSAAGAGASTTDDVRGEWALTFTCTCTFPVGEPHTMHGTSIIRTMNATSGEFAGSILLAGILPGTISGSLSGSQVASLMAAAQTPAGPVTFTMTSGTVNGADDELSGMGYYGAAGPGAPEGDFTATKLRSLEAVEKEEEEIRNREKAKEEEEIKIKAEEEKAKEKAKEEEEAKARAKAEEMQAAAKAQEEKEKQAAKEKIEKEAREAQEAQAAKEAKEQAAAGKGSAIQPAGLSGKTFAVTGSGVVSLGLSNPNGYSISGEVTLSAAPAGKTSKGKAVLFAGASYTVSARGAKTVKLKLSKSGLAMLGHHKTLRVVIKITTRSSGQPTIVKTSEITLKAPVAKRH